MTTRANQRMAKTASIVLAAFALSAGSFAPTANAQIARTVDTSGREMFVNADPPVVTKFTAAKPRKTIYLPAESSFMGSSHPAMSIDRDGAEKLVKESAERHNVDPALVRAVIETESNWNPSAYSRKGAGGLMQLIPTTAQRYGANDVFNPQQNIDAGVRHLRVCWNVTMATWNWPWRRTMRVRGLLIGLTASLRSGKPGTTCRRYRMRIFGLDRVVLRARFRIHAPSTEKSIPPDASFSRTTNVLRNKKYGSASCREAAAAKLAQSMIALRESLQRSCEESPSGAGFFITLMRRKNVGRGCWGSEKF